MLKKMNEKEALKAIRRGVVAGFISVLLTIIGIFLSANPGAQQTMPTFLADPFILLGLSIFIIAIVGLMFKSRIAAIFLLSDFVISKIMILTEAPADH